MGMNIGQGNRSLLSKEGEETRWDNYYHDYYHDEDTTIPIPLSNVTLDGLSKINTKFDANRVAFFPFPSTATMATTHPGLSMLSNLASDSHKYHGNSEGRREDRLLGLPVRKIGTERLDLLPWSSIRTFLSQLTNSSSLENGHPDRRSTKHPNQEIPYQPSSSQHILSLERLLNGSSQQSNSTKFKFDQSQQRHRLSAYPSLHFNPHQHPPPPPPQSNRHHHNQRNRHNAQNHRHHPTNRNKFDHSPLPYLSPSSPTASSSTSSHSSMSSSRPTSPDARLGHQQQLLQLQFQFQSQPTPRPLLLQRHSSSHHLIQLPPINAPPLSTFASGPGGGGRNEKGEVFQIVSRRSSIVSMDVDGNNSPLLSSSLPLPTAVSPTPLLSPALSLNNQSLPHMSNPTSSNGSGNLNANVPRRPRFQPYVVPVRVSYTRGGAAGEEEMVVEEEEADFVGSETSSSNSHHVHSIVRSNSGGRLGEDQGSTTSGYSNAREGHDSTYRESLERVLEVALSSHSSYSGNSEGSIGQLDTAIEAERDREEEERAGEALRGLALMGNSGSSAGSLSRSGSAE